ncbi:MAG: glycosyltransferase [Smithella sp.]|nr:glycosyltransferase [Smithella sp.]
MTLPLVTIMIPTYNQAAYLEDALRSALGQDYANLEIIIADDCSSDNTSEIVHKFTGDEKIRYFRNEKNLGKTANYRHTLYELARGEWVLNLDGDDYLTDASYISFAMRQISLHENVVLFTAGVKHTGQRKFRPPYTHRLVAEQIFMKGIDLFLNWHQYKIPHLTTLYHRPTACRIGFYEIDISSTDWESLLRLALHGNVILSEKIAAVWRRHDNNLSLAMDYNQFKANFAFIERPLAYAVSKGYDKALMQNWRQTMTDSVMRGQFDEVWHNVIRKNSFGEIKNFIKVVWKEKPEFIKNFFRLTNMIFFCLHAGCYGEKNVK